MRTKDIPKIRDMILETLGDMCEKIILFGSYAYGIPQEESDIDIYVVLKDDSKNPLLVMEALVLLNTNRLMCLQITVCMAERPASTIAAKGVVLYG